MSNPPPRPSVRNERDESESPAQSGSTTANNSPDTAPASPPSVTSANISQDSISQSPESEATIQSAPSALELSRQQQQAPDVNSPTVPFPTIEDDSESSTSTPTASASTSSNDLRPVQTRVGQSLSDLSTRPDINVREPSVDRPRSAEEETTHAPAAGLPTPVKRGRVRFNSKSEVDNLGTRFQFPLQDTPVATSSLRPPEPSAGKKGKGRGVGSPIRFTSIAGFKREKHKDKGTSRENSPVGAERKASDSSSNDPFSDRQQTATPAGSTTDLNTGSIEKAAANVVELKAPIPTRPRPSVLRQNSANSFSEEQMWRDEGLGVDGHMDETARAKHSSAKAAHDRAQKVAQTVHGDLPLREFDSGSPKPGFARVPTKYRRESGPTSPLSRETSPVMSGASGKGDIPLMDLDDDHKRRARSNSGGYRNGGLDSDSDSDSDERLTKEDKDKKKADKKKKKSSAAEAFKLVRAHTMHENTSTVSIPRSPSPRPDLIEQGLESGRVTPVDERDADDWVPRPDHYRGGVLSSLLKLYNQPAPETDKKHHRYSSLGGDSSRATTPTTSGQTTPKQKPPKWYNQKSASTTTLANLIEASSQLAAHGAANSRGDDSGTNTPGGSAEAKSKGPRAKRPGMHARQHSNGLGKAYDKLKRPRLQEEIRITVHIAETLSRQKYLIRLCRALMAYGAPTHRLEEYMRMTARVLELDVQVLYIPGCMLISFDDASTHTTEVKLVRTNQGVNLGKLKDVHEIYKEVVHDVTGVEEATQRLEAIIREKPKHHKWLLVLVYGFASACVGPFAFESNWIDLPIAFILGLCLGFLQLIIAPKSDLYANVFEISAAVVTSFLARAFGSINYNGHRLFCFSALAQSSIALILPGYIILCGSLELQSKSIVAGSVRMFYAVIYSLFLGFGITIGTAFYGAMDSNAVSEITCRQPMTQYVRFIFVPLFTMCLCTINQAKWKQTPVMILISFSGYLVNFFTSRRFPGNSQISQTLGAFTIGVLGNLYSRLRHGVAAAALLPAIFVQVPSGLAAGGSLLSGLTSANDIVRKPNGTSAAEASASAAATATQVSTTAPISNILSPKLATGVEVLENMMKRAYDAATEAMLEKWSTKLAALGGLSALSGGATSGVETLADQTTTKKTLLALIAGMEGLNGALITESGNAAAAAAAGLNSVVFNVGYSMIQVAIGISVGLFLSALVVYPFGKRRSGLFSF